jgi:enoyl-CoA hydratase/carnithine racemase
MSSAREPSILTSTTPNGITTITLNRPHVKNAINGPATASLLYEAFLAFEADAIQKVCVFTGSGDTFCAGFDLHYLAASKNQPPATNGPEKVQGRNIAPMGPSRLLISKPVIAAVSGYAVAGGLELSLIADMRVVDESAIFGVLCRRWGVPLIDGGTVRLPAIVGLGRAIDMILTGRPVDAKEALAMGLANRVVPVGKALEKAYAIAERLIEFPQLCMNADRKSAYYAAFEAKSLEDALANEYAQGIEVTATESVEGAERFSGGLGRHGSFDSSSKSRGAKL